MLPQTIILGDEGWKLFGPDPDRTVDRVGPDRTEAIRSGPRSKGMSYSVLGPVPVWTGGPNIEEGFFLSVVCGTVVPWSTARPCQNSAQSKSTFQIFNVFYFSTFPFPNPPVPVPPLLQFSFTASTSLHAFLACPAPSSVVSCSGAPCSVLVPRPRYRYSLSHSLRSLSQASAESLRLSQSHSLLSQISVSLALASLTPTGRVV